MFATRVSMDSRTRFRFCLSFVDPALCCAGAATAAPIVGSAAPPAPGLRGESLAPLAPVLPIKLARRTALNTRSAAAVSLTKWKHWFRFSSGVISVMTVPDSIPGLTALTLGPYLQSFRQPVGSNVISFRSWFSLPREAWRSCRSLKAPKVSKPLLLFLRRHLEQTWSCHGAVVRLGASRPCRPCTCCTCPAANSAAAFRSRKCRQNALGMLDEA
mmetsp:Transcript_9462/g.22076  ORF Transcript_9462/g.22076 Transcript_9462/m.22076 type:complete len:215 (+) Transcript_9462:180-824(+)